MKGCFSTYYSCEKCDSCKEKDNCKIEKERPRERMCSPTMNKNERNDTDLECINASGFGGTYVDLISTGLKYLEGHKPFIDELKIGESDDGYHLSMGHNDFSRGFILAILRGDPVSRHHFFGSMGHAQLIYNHGYENWIKEAKKRNRLTTIYVPKEVYDLFHSFNGHT